MEENFTERNEVSGQASPAIGNVNDREHEEKKEEVEYFCGIGRFRPKYLQVFRSPNFFFFLLCCDVLFGGALATGMSSDNKFKIIFSVELNFTADEHYPIADRIESNNLAMIIIKFRNRCRENNGMFNFFVNNCRLHHRDSY